MEPLTTASLVVSLQKISPVDCIIPISLICIHWVSKSMSRNRGRERTTLNIEEQVALRLPIDLARRLRPKLKTGKLEESIWFEFPGACDSSPLPSSSTLLSPPSFELLLYS